MVASFFSALTKPKNLWIFAVVMLVVAVIAGMWYLTQTVGFVVAEPQVSYRCAAGKTVMNSLVLSNTVVFEQTDQGPTVIAINGVTSDETRRWSFTIDGQPSNNSGLTVICSGREQVIWQLK